MIMGMAGIWNNTNDFSFANCILKGTPLGNPGNVIYIHHSYINGDIYPGTGNITTDPLLGALGDHGGPVKTISLLEGSPAINGGFTGLPEIPSHDARGVLRDHPDMGAFEASTDMSISMSHDGTGEPGENAVFIITVTNNGTEPAYGLTVYDTLPTGMSFVSLALPEGWSGGNTGNDVIASCGAMAPGSSAVIRITADISPALPVGSTVSNSASITHICSDPDSGNNAATVTIMLRPKFVVTPQLLSLTEGGASAGFSVVLTGMPAADVSVTVTSGDSTQLTVAPSTLVFTSATWSVPQTVTVTAVDDALLNGTRSVTAILGTAASADPLFQGLDPENVAITIADNDSTSSSGSGGGGGGGGGGNLPAAVSSNSGSAHIHPSQSGTLHMGGAVSLHIPANSLSGASSLWIRIQESTAANDPPAGFTMLGSAYEFEVDGSDHYTFTKPVRLSFVFDPSAVPEGSELAVCYFDPKTSQWVRLDSTVSGNIVSATVDHFTLFAVMAVNKMPTEIPATFLDTDGHWAQDAIGQLVRSGAVSGYPDGHFRPDAPITRGEFVMMLVKALNLRSENESQVFNDTRDHFARDYIAVAATHGRVMGYGNNTFDPDALITREQMAVISVKTLAVEAAESVTPYSDSDDISSWAKDSVLKATQKGILTGYTDSTFRPKGHTTRAEAAQVILRLIK